MVTKRLLRQEKEHPCRGPKSSAEEAKCIQKSEGKVAAIPAGSPLAGPGPVRGHLLLLCPTSTLPLLVTAPRLSLWKYFCTFLTQGLGHDPAEANQSLSCLVQGQESPKPE